MTADARTRRLRELHDTMAEYIEWFGAIHSEDCPADDTCDCIGGDLNRRVNETMQNARAVLDTEGDRQEPQQNDEAAYILDGIACALGMNGRTMADISDFCESFPIVRAVMDLVTMQQSRADTEGDRHMGNQLSTHRPGHAETFADCTHPDCCERRKLDEFSGADTEGDRPAQLPCGCYIAQCPTHRSQPSALPDPPVQP